MIHRYRLFLFPIFIALLSDIASAAEPLVGKWKLTSQVVNGAKVDTDELILRIYPSGNALEFAYSVPVNGVHIVSTKFLAVRLNGTDSDVTNVKNTKVGTVKITKSGASEYKIVMQGPSRPTAAGKVDVSQDGNTLTFDSVAVVPGHGETKTVQTFSRDR